MKKIVISFVLITLGMLLFSLRTDEQHSTDNRYEELVAVSTTEEAASEILVINEIGKHFTIAITALPQLATYLQTEPDPAAELARIHYEFLSGGSDHFVLKYGCGNKRCHLLLVELLDSKVGTTFDLGEGIFAGEEVFQQRAMLLIAENEGGAVVRHKILLMDLSTMNPFQPIDQQLAARYFEEALYPITKFEWLSETAIRLEVADLEEASFEEVERWYQEEEPDVRVVEIELR